MSNPPPPQQAHPPQGYYPPQQPKKKHTARNIILVLVGLMILAFGGCMALVAGGVNEIDKAITASEKQDRASGGPDNPMTIQAGKAFEIRGMEFQKGWKLNSFKGLGTSVERLRVENNRGDEGEDSVFVEIKFMKGNEVLGQSDCSTDGIAFGQMVRASCIATDGVMKRFDRITVNDTF